MNQFNSNNFPQEVAAVIRERHKEGADIAASTSLIAKEEANRRELFQTSMPNTGRAEYRPMRVFLRLGCRRR
jgi:hypothetical protein